MRKFSLAGHWESVLYSHDWNHPMYWVDKYLENMDDHIGLPYGD